MTLAGDRRMIEIWAETGIPNDPSTLTAAGQILRQLLSELDEWKHIFDQLDDAGYLARLHKAIEDETGECVPCVLGDHEDCVAASTDVCECFDRDHDGEAA